MERAFDPEVFVNHCTDQENGMSFDEECDIVGEIIEMIEEAQHDGELDEAQAEYFKARPEEALRWLEDTCGISRQHFVADAD